MKFNILLSSAISILLEYMYIFDSDQIREF